jgi:hypothetical protein
MAAVGGSAAACCAVLLAAVLLFSAPATTGSAPLLYLPQPGPSHPLDGAASCREPANWLDPAARSPPCIGETERPRGSDCVPVNATPISPSPVGVGGSSSVSVASNQDPTGLIQLDSEFRTRLRKPHTYLTHAKLPQCHSLLILGQNSLASCCVTMDLFRRESKLVKTSQSAVFCCLKVQLPV